MKKYKIVFEVQMSDWTYPDWIIGEVRDLFSKSNDRVTYASVEEVVEE